MGNDDIPGVVKTQAQLKTIWRIMIKVNKIQTKHQVMAFFYILILLTQ
jgi:hypothetical protein